MTVVEGPLDPTHLRQLVHFLAVARAGGFRRAATTAGVQQPTLTKSVGDLESRLGSPLLVRTAAGVTLTDVGRRLLARCEAIEALVRSPLDDAPASLTGEVRIATHEHVAAYLLPAWVRTLTTRHPNLAVRITTGTAHRLLRELESGAFDFALLSTYPDRPGLTRRGVARFACGLVVAPDQVREAAVMERFIGSRELDDDAGRDFPALDHLKRSWPAARIAVSCNSLEAHKRLVLAGLGVAILPEFVVRAELADGRLERADTDFVYMARLDVLRVQGRRASAQVRAALAALDDTPLVTDSV